jgi:gas vesicle protein
MSQDRNNQTVFWSGLLLGSGIGAVISLLVTPRTGKENREVLKKTASALPEMADDFTTTLQVHSNRLSSSASQNWQQTLNRLQNAIASGVEASHNYHKQNKDQNSQSD